jgi:hypothetical protein
LEENKLVATGFDKVPYFYLKDGSDWKMTKCLDDGINAVRTNKITGNSFLDKKIYFNNDMKLGSSIEMKEKDTKHLNYINCLKVFAKNGEKPMILSTSDINGYLNFWDVQKL